MMWNQLTPGQKISVFLTTILAWFITINTLRMFHIPYPWLDILVSVLLFFLIPLVFARSIGVIIAIIIDILIDRISH